MPDLHGASFKTEIYLARGFREQTLTTPTYTIPTFNAQGCKMPPLSTPILQMQT